MSGAVHVEVDGPVATLVLDHPGRRNALSVAMWEQLRDGAMRLAGDEAVRVVVLRGAGEEAFASGADISEFEDTRSDATRNRVYDATTAGATAALVRMEKPVLALVHGFCLGGGLAVALTADLRYGADDASFSIPAARLGIGYNWPGIAGLVRLVGPSATKRLLFTGSRISAADALNIGLVDEVLPKAQLDDRVAEVAATIAANAPLSIRAVKLAVAELARDPADRDWARVEAAAAACFDSDDFAEGVRAFLEKRRPHFTGH